MTQNINPLIMYIRLYLTVNTPRLNDAENASDCAADYDAGFVTDYVKEYAQVRSQCERGSVGGRAPSTPFL